MSFLSPEYFWLFVLLLGMMLFRRNRAESSLELDGKRKVRLLYLALIFIIVALSRPVIESAKVKQEFEGSEVVIALDLSFSMQAQDVSPNRLDASIAKIKELIISRVHERFALIGFTSSAIIISPLSSDDELLSHQLDLINPNNIITKSTNIASILELTTKLSEVKNKHLIIFGDGGDKEEFTKEIHFAREQGIAVSVVMMATQSGARLKQKDDTWLKDSSDNLVISSSNSRIKALVEATGGVYVNYDENVVGELSEYIDEIDKKLFKADILIYQELFYFPALLALMSFILAVTKLHRYPFTWLASLLLLFGVNLNALDKGEFSQESGEGKVYVEQRYVDALEKAKKHLNRSPEDDYNIASLYYRVGEFEKAIDIFKTIQTDRAELKAKVFHNMGNSYIRLEMYEQAREAFTKALILQYDKETDENLQYIAEFEKHEGLQTGQQKGEKRNESVQSKSENKEGEKSEDGGSSNMKVQAAASSSANSRGKKTKTEGEVQFNASQSALTFKQYELINERSVNEENPW